MTTGGAQAAAADLAALAVLPEVTLARSAGIPLAAERSGL